MSLLVAACGGTTPPVSSEPVEAESEPAVQAQVSGPASEEVSPSEAAEWLCQRSTELMQNRARPAPRRMNILWEQARRNGVNAVVRRLAEGVEEQDSQYGMLVQAFEGADIRFSCTPLERMLQLVEAGDDDLDLSDMAPLAEDWTAACRVAVEVNGMPEDELGTAPGGQPIDRRFFFVARVAQEITNQDLAEAIFALAGAPAEYGAEMLEGFAADEGLTMCPELVEVIAPPSATP